MPSQQVRLTLVNNARQTQKAVILVPQDNLSAALPSIEAAAKSKLRLKRVEHLFDVRGNAIKDLSALHNGDSLLLSAGENFIGKPSSPDCDTFTDAGPAAVRTIANKAHVTPEALAQLKAVSRMPGMLRVVGLPDLHMGQQSPVGAAYFSKGRIHPALVDADIGCGMTLLSTSMKKHTDPEKIAKELFIEGPFNPSRRQQEKEQQEQQQQEETEESQVETADEDGQASKQAEESDQEDSAAERAANADKEAEAQTLVNKVPQDNIGDIDFSQFLSHIGTIGGGNHFAEFQTLDEVFKPEMWPQDISQDHLFLLVHSGSRGLGRHILSETQDGPLEEGTAAFDKYMKQHDAAVDWARVNRETIAHRMLVDCLGQSADSTTQVLEMAHNTVVKKPEGYLHRKGAAPSDEDGQLGVIPGSRGHKTWLVRSKGDQAPNGSFSFP